MVGDECVYRATLLMPTPPASSDVTAPLCPYTTSYQLQRPPRARARPVFGQQAEDGRMPQVCASFWVQGRAQQWNCRHKSPQPVFFNVPVSLHEQSNTIYICFCNYYYLYLCCAACYIVLLYYEKKLVYCYVWTIDGVFILFYCSLLAGLQMLARGLAGSIGV